MKNRLSTMTSIGGIDKIRGGANSLKLSGAHGVIFVRIQIFNL